MTDEQRERPPLEEIVRAMESVRARHPASGPGWSVCFKDKRDRVVLSCAMGSFTQVESLADAVARLGFALVILDGEARCDFVFAQGSEATDVPVLSDAAATVLRGLPPTIAASSRPIVQGCLAMQDTGGPVMLVSSMGGELAYCVWFAENAGVCSGTFHTARLVNVDSAQRAAAQLAPAETARQPA